MQILSTSSVFEHVTNCNEKLCSVKDCSKASRSRDIKAEVNECSERNASDEIKRSRTIAGGKEKGNQFMMRGVESTRDEETYVIVLLLRLNLTVDGEEK